MAKSLRSKWKRKCRAVKRVRYGQRELERLKKALSNDPLNKPKDEEMRDISEVATFVDKETINKGEESADKETDDIVEEMESGVRTRKGMKSVQNENGTSVWTNKKNTRRGKSAHGKSKKKKFKKSKSKRL